MTLVVKEFIHTKGYQCRNNNNKYDYEHSIFKNRHWHTLVLIEVKFFLFDTVVVVLISAHRLVQ